MQPILLHIESSTDICSIAVSKGVEVIGFSETREAYQHASQMTLLIDAAMQEAGLSLGELSAVSVSLGPGSYTSLRVGFSTAKGICYALGKPLITVPSLLALAGGMAKEEKVQSIEDPTTLLYVPMIDARRMEVYRAIYDQKLESIQEAEAVIIDDSVFETDLAQGKHLILGGNGAPKTEEVLTHPQVHFVSVVASARQLVPFALQNYEEGRFADVAYVEPFYLKPPNITISKKKFL
ncbi:MAG: tRNA (adenosine(37)-N6)-threonylcarbamoyltransferase complex dimerization subunit type 1 TsaB [Saprospiraceae bacterium]|nr:tRNA (adenosine(37)-N6)-threonylcarbamoyltransferase complex dimerization subunit type 1 TsaB [Saprospiraceae bacterium]